MLQYQNLKCNRMEDASWPDKNVANVELFASAGFIWFCDQ